MTFGDILDTHEPSVRALVDRSNKQLAAAKNLLKAVQTGNFREVDKLRSEAEQRVRDATVALGEISPIDFDTEAYLGPDGAFFEELKAAADEACVSLFIRDGLIYCYPVLVKTLPTDRTVQIDKKKYPTLRPSILAADLKKRQQKGAQANNARFFKTLHSGYKYAAAVRKVPEGADVALTDVHAALTVAPEMKSSYSLLDFTRDVYMLDIAGMDESADSHRVTFSASTSGREAGKKLLHFVDRDGHEKTYAMVRFVTVPKGADSGDAL